jgi:hypothetical protein
MALCACVALGAGHAADWLGLHGDPHRVTRPRRDASVLMSMGSAARESRSRGGQNGAPAPERQDEADDVRQLVVGAWTREQHGSHVLRYAADGTATIEASLDFLSSLLYGEHLTLKLEWTLCDGVLTHRVVGGEPAANVARLVRDFGNRREYELVGVEHGRLRVRRVGEEAVAEWTAVSDDDGP